MSKKLTPELRARNRRIEQELGAYLKRLRQQRGWGRMEITSRGGPAYATVREHETGEVKTLARLAEHLAVFDCGLDDAWRFVSGDRSSGLEGPELRTMALDASECLLVNTYRATTSRARAVMLDQALLFPRLPVEEGTQVPGSRSFAETPQADQLRIATAAPKGDRPTKRALDTKNRRTPRAS